MVAEILGHSIEAARGYSLPTDADKQAAIARLAIDEQPPSTSSHATLRF